jgi:hypothetical protein
MVTRNRRAGQPSKPRSARQKKTAQGKGKSERELLRKIPQDIQASEERGERLETARTIASGGKTASGEQRGSVPTISRQELQAMIEGGENFTLVETLPLEAYAKAHLPGSINLPPDRLAELAPQLLPNKKAKIVVYCASFT